MKTFPEVLTVRPILSAAGEVPMPGSKSISNRALLLAALSSGRTELKGILRAEDTERMMESLRKLGVSVEIDEGNPKTVTVEGCGGRFAVRSAELFLGNAGTAARPLTAALALAGGSYLLDGVERMRERPIGDLLVALRSLGAEIECLNREGYFPLRIGERRSVSGKASCHISGEVSSQFITALLLSSPVYSGPEGLEIIVDGHLISRPYVLMTLKLMEQFGVHAEDQGDRFFVPHAEYRRGNPYLVEGDASGASYFLALGALSGPADGPGVRVTGVGRDSIQGDVQFAAFLERMGARIAWGENWIEARPPVSGKLHGIHADCTEIPDAAMTLAAIGLMAEGETVLTGIGSWRVKETDRIAAMQAELSKFGADVKTGDDWLSVTAPQKRLPAEVSTYKDHRMAMSLSLAACGGVSVRILDPGCVSKTFPDYFERLAGLVKTAPLTDKD